MLRHNEIRWHNCSEKMPARSGYYLLTISYGELKPTIRRTCIAYYNKENFEIISPKITATIINNVEWARIPAIGDDKWHDFQTDVIEPSKEINRLLLCKTKVNGRLVMRPLIYYSSIGEWRTPNDFKTIGGPKYPIIKWIRIEDI